MPSAKDSLKQILKEIDTQRDELELKIHLAKADARDEWEGFEKKLDHLRSKSKHVAEEATEAAGETAEALKLVGEELLRGYKRVRDSL